MIIYKKETHAVFINSSNLETPIVLDVDVGYRNRLQHPFPLKYMHNIE